MTPDRIYGGYVDLLIEEGRRVKAKVILGKIFFVNGAGTEVKSARKAKVPEGTIESLRPLLQEAFNLFGQDQDSGYWEELQEKAPHNYTWACNRLKRAGINHVEAARLLLGSEPRIQEALAHGHINNDNIEGIVSLVADNILQQYNRK